MLQNLLCFRPVFIETAEEKFAVLGSTILDVAIGIVFVFLLASLIASAVREGLEAWLKTRASHLEAGLREILRDPDGTGLVKHFYEHPLIFSLYSGQYVANPKLNTGVMSLTRGGNLPSYIPSRNFAMALLDMAARGPQTESTVVATGRVTFEAVRSNVGSIENPAVQRALLVALDSAQGDLGKAQANLEAWYNSAMDRVSGWYRRSTQGILLGLGLVLAVTLNISTIRIGDTLIRDRTTRDLVVATAQKAQTSTLDYATANQALAGLHLPIGWPSGIRKELKDNGPSDLLGWVLTAFAVSVGAPFWFDMLNRLIVIRSTVKPHQKSPEEASTDNRASASSPDASPTVATPIPALVQEVAFSPPPETLQHVLVQPTRTADEDGCDVDTTVNVTLDEMLPAAMGGVR